MFIFIYCSNGYNILLYGFGFKRILFEDFRRLEFKDLDYVVVNGYFLSLIIKYVSVYIFSYLEINIIL